jgi:hypothetical protein
MFSVHEPPMVHCRSASIQEKASSNQGAAHGMEVAL